LRAIAFPKMLAKLCTRSRSVWDHSRSCRTQLTLSELANFPLTCNGHAMKDLIPRRCQNTLSTLASGGSSLIRSTTAGRAASIRACAQGTTSAGTEVGPGATPSTAQECVKRTTPA
jgi:hypothetical protein